MERWPKKNSLRLAFHCMDTLLLCCLLVMLPFGVYIGIMWPIGTAKEQRALTAMVVLQVLVLHMVLAGLEILYFSWLHVRDLALIYWYDKAPSEAEILLLEWERNRSCDYFMPYIRYAAAIKVIEKARSHGYEAANDRNAYTSFDYEKDSVESADCVTGKLRELLLAKQLENPQEQSCNPWEYDHHQWAYKSLWPTNYSRRFVALLLLDSYWIGKYSWTILDRFELIWFCYILMIPVQMFSPEDEVVDTTWVYFLYLAIRIGQTYFAQNWWLHLEHKQKGLRLRCLLSLTGASPSFNET